MSTKKTVLQSFARLEGHQDFEEVLEHLRNLRDDATERMAQSTDAILIGRAQGEYQALTNFLKLASTARETMQRLG